MVAGREEGALSAPKKIEKKKVFGSGEKDTPYPIRGKSAH